MNLNERETHNELQKYDLIIFDFSVIGQIRRKSEEIIMDFINKNLNPGGKLFLIEVSLIDTYEGRKYTEDEIKQCKANWNSLTFVNSSFHNDLLSKSKFTRVTIIQLKDKIPKLKANQMKHVSHLKMKINNKTVRLPNIKYIDLLTTPSGWRCNEHKNNVYDCLRIHLDLKRSKKPSIMTTHELTDTTKIENYYDNTNNIIVPIILRTPLYFENLPKKISDGFKEYNEKKNIYPLNNVNNNIFYVYEKP